MRFAKCLMALSAIWGFSSALDLQCAGTVQKSWWVVGKIFTCDVENMQITKRGEVMTSASTVTNYNQVKGINVDREIMKYFPKFTEELGQRIAVISVYYSDLIAIERDDLRPFPLLRYLSLVDNYLSSLPGDLFLSTPKLEYLSLTDNPLKKIGSNILDTLSNLKKAEFIRAGCINMKAENPAAIENLTLEVQAKCKPAEEVRQEKLKLIELTNEVAQLKQKNAELELEAHEGQRKLAAAEKRFQEEKTRSTQLSQQISNIEVIYQDQQKKTASEEQNLKQQLRSCDRNLNSATQILSPLLAQVAFSSNHQSNVELICSRYSNETKTCNVIDFSIENSATKVVSVKDELGNEVRPTSLIIRHQAALFLPTNLHAFFPHLQHLEVTSSGLFHVNSKTFNKLEKLVSLNLTSNKISSIVSGLFPDLKSLQLLDLSSNKLELIEAGGFDGLQSIKVLNLKNNKLNRIAASFMSSMTSLDSIDLRGNSCVNLVHPEISFKVIEAAIIENCVAPLKLICTTSNDHHVCDVENLQVEHAKAKILTVNGKSPENVTKLAVEGQIVKFLPANLSRTFPKLQKLVVWRSQLTVLTKTDFVGLTDLHWVEICDNQMSSIEAGTFDAVAHLVHLDLSSNHIRTLPTKIFERLTQLIELRLSINELKVLNSDIFPVPNSIKVFRGDNNKLEEIDMKVLVILRNADEIDLEGNNCIDDKYEKDDENSKKAFAGFFGLVVIDCEPELVA